MNIKAIIKYKLSMFFYKYLLSPITFSDIDTKLEELNLEYKNICILTETSNNVIEVKFEDTIYYFRECKVHKKIHEYVNDLIEQYFADIVRDDYQDRKFIENSLKDKRNFKKFINMGITNDKNSAAYKYCMYGKEDLIGFNFCDVDRKERLKNFVQFVWGELYAYKLNAGVKINQYQTFNSVRSIATYRMAKLIGLEDMIPKTKYVVLNTKNSKKLGTLMEQAPGRCMKRNTENERKSVVSPKLQHELNNLNLLDVICYEKDHKPSNYNVLVENGKAKKICAFDNDSPMAFGLGNATFNTYMNCTPLISKYGEINRDYLDRRIVNNILQLDVKKIDEVFADLLNKRQIKKLKSRICKLRNAFKSCDTNIFINDEAWSEETVTKEMNSKHGRTYLKLFTEDLKLPNQPWIKNEENINE